MRRSARTAVIAAVRARAAPAGQENQGHGVRPQASLTNVLQELGGEYTKASGTTVVFSFAADVDAGRARSRGGAHADVFFSADQEWMDYLDQRGLIPQGVAPQPASATAWRWWRRRTGTLTLHIEPNFPPGSRPLAPGGRLATGDPDSVPVGKYARFRADDAGRLERHRRPDWCAPTKRAYAALAFVARAARCRSASSTRPMLRSNRAYGIVDLFPASSQSSYKLSYWCDRRRQ